MTFWKYVLIALLALGCEEGNPSAGSNSNWLKACQTSANCAKSTDCRCGSCTRRCSSDVDCAGLDDAHCVLGSAPALRSMCSAGSTESGLCLPRCQPGTCGEGRVCLLGACVIVAPVSAELCASLDTPSEADRAREDEVLDAFQSRRLDGGVSCAGAAATAPGAALRFDARLACAARAVAADVNSTRTYSATDSMGLSAADRLRAAGYELGFWGEGVAIDARNAEHALTLMLRDQDACVGLTAATSVDVGVAHVGDIDVVTVAEP